MDDIDSTVLPAAVERALADYYGTIRITDLVQAYNGDVRELARDLADLKGTKEASQMRQINRWLKSESGREGQRRTPSRSQADLRKLMAGRNPPANVTAKVRGKLKSTSGKYSKQRSVDTANAMGGPADAGALLDALLNGDMWDAYDALFSEYAPGLYAEEADSIDVSFS